MIRVNYYYYELAQFNAVNILKSYGFIFSDANKDTAIKIKLEDELSTAINRLPINNPIDLIRSSGEKYRLLKKGKVKIESV